MFDSTNIYLILLAFDTIRIYAIMQHNIVAGLIVGGLGLCAFIFIFVRVVLFFSHTRTSRGNDIIQVMPRPHVLTAFFENGRYFGCLRGVIVETLNAPKILPCVIHTLLSL